MRLRYAGRCRACSVSLAAGATAFYDPIAKTVTCVPCGSPAEQTAPSQPAVGQLVGEVAARPATGDAPAVPDDSHRVLPVAESRQVDQPTDTEGVAVIGEAGASARREHDRRHQRREERIRAEHPRIGGLILALSEDPQSTRAWATGAAGEERLAVRLDAAAGDRLRLLHDRRIPRSRANIDHIAVTASGVFVIDAKRYTGRPDLRVEGGLLRPRVEKLVVGRRDCTKLVDGVRAQVDVVRSLLAASHPQTPVQGVLCFVDADWPLVGGDFSTRGVYVMWPRKLQKRLLADGDLSVEVVANIHHMLALRLPAA